jgi:positive regulator of sigma E activity
MTVMAYIIPLFVILFGVWLGYQLSRRGLFRQIAVLMACAAAGFWICRSLARTGEGWDGIGYVIVAMFVILPGAGGLFIGLVTGGWRRYRERLAHG